MPPPPPIPLAHMLNRVRAFVTGTLGFDHVFDTTFLPVIALRGHAREIFERKERAVSIDGGGGGGALPMLSSIAATKCPQQVMGSLVKG